MNILENELVRSKFSCEANQCKSLEAVEHDWLSCMALRVLTAMQERIKKGERYLRIDCTRTYKPADIDENVASTDGPSSFHGHELRLPSQFQPTREIPEEVGWLWLCVWCNESMTSYGKGRHDCKSKLQPEAGKCYRHNPTTMSVPDLEQCTCKPVDAVEEKVKSLADEIGEIIRVATNRGGVFFSSRIGILKQLEELLRLDRLARGGK